MNAPLAGFSGEESSLTDADIYDRIVGAVLDHRLPPGTRLAEEKLGRAFGVSRTRIRQVLVRLAAEQVIVLEHNRGATVASPTPQDAQEVFGARMLIEPPLIEAFVQQADDAALDALIRSLHDEEAANEAGDRRAAIRLSGEFHLLIAEGSGNATLAKILRELVSRTSLILMTFGQKPGRRGAAHPHDGGCGCDEHAGLVGAIRERDARLAGRLMKKHLAHLLAGIAFEQPADEAPDIETLFRSH
ncbi:GntR family transcriptional regulator [Uliginosibacterium paludis]|uniref:GntR family transcriptional regulator n=1 Tax=Uliginosibacterium paludis TaxID=1615952 RepID=A0ABV2CMC9_9RHOO